MHELLNKLELCKNTLCNRSLIELLNDSDRVNHLTFKSDDIIIDAAKNHIDAPTLKHLIELAKSKDLKVNIDKLFSGDLVNLTEQRPALHPLLRSASSEHPLHPEVQNEKERLIAFAEKVRRGELLGTTDQVIDTIVNIGIGGSDLGAQLVFDAFGSKKQSNIKIHFLSDVDYTHLANLMAQLNLERTLFILCSKSFGTIEPLTNAEYVIGEYQKTLGENAWQQHFVAVSSKETAMTKFGILKPHQFLVWESIGGRYSVWSSMNLICRIGLGNDVVDEFLAGANQMDEHFRSADFSENLPVLLALIQYWNIHWMHHKIFISLTYSHALNLFPSYQQQLEMESNGKSIDRDGNPIDYMTCPFVFGQLGLNAQHSFMQLVHQSNHDSYIEFFAVPDKNVSFEKDIAYRNCLAQSRALAIGEAQSATPHHRVEGNNPSTTIVLKEISPKNLGQLVALYEHKVYVQSVLWNINPFDQFGVELGKKIASNLRLESLNDEHIDASTKQLIKLHFDE